MKKKAAAKKPVYNKFLLHYTGEINGEAKTLWDKIQTTKGPCYKNATTVLKRKLHGRGESRIIKVIKVHHLYKIKV